ncbi:MAG: glutathione S-transferase family protein [Pseudomonadota bacterium]
MIYLHHYDASLFSEKIRVLLGYLDLEWHSVEISSVMPRPLLMPLTGGYRRTPVLQIDANVYCDTAIITRALIRHAEAQDRLLHDFAATRIAEWADTQLFRVAVALNFRPEALGAMMQNLSSTDIETFQKDRAELSKGASIVSYSTPAAFGYLAAYLDELEATLTGSSAAYLFGSTPSVADFSIYHCLWFLRNNPVNRELLASHGATLDWYRRIGEFGHGTRRNASAEAALATAREHEPVLPTLIGEMPQHIEAGRQVTIAPVDYGRIPVAGRLVAANSEELVLERETPETARVFTHFPNAGFEIGVSD